MAAKSKAAKGEGAPPAPKPRKALKSATLMHITIHPEEGVISCSVQQDVAILGDTQRQGRDVVVKLEDLPAAVRKNVEAGFSGVAKYVGAKE